MAEQIEPCDPGDPYADPPIPPSPPVYAPLNFNPFALVPFLGDITHSPFELMAYLTAAYGDFAEDNITAVIDEIFAAAFSLNVVNSSETRSCSCGGTEYTWHFREVILSVNATISDILHSRMDDEQREHFDILMQSYGLRQVISSPFATDWTGNLTSPFGYRLHPITGAAEMHTGIDIAKPTGTPLLSVMEGASVISAGDRGAFGLTVELELIHPQTGQGVRVLYAHMNSINVSVSQTVERGYVVGTVGSTGVSTGAHLHIEMRINDGDGGGWSYTLPLKWCAYPLKS